MAGDPKLPRLPEPPKLPQRAAIYIAPDGTVHFGALFAALVPVAKSLNPTLNLNLNVNDPCSED